MSSKKIKLLLFQMLALCCLFSVIKVQAQLPAFPGAEGAGMYTTGGRGTPITSTTVFEVTNLNDNNLPGSLRYALTASATYRTVVFRVSGTIHLNSGLNIPANTTIAGQTAPGDGICVSDYPVYIKGDNVIVRYMRFRLGDRYQNKGMVDGAGSDDAFGGTGPSNIIIDHITASWSTDEALTIYRGDNLTIQWCMISEPLNYSYHFEAGDLDYEHHGYGGIWGAKRGTMHHNLIAHCRNRNPRFAGISTYTPSTIGVENVDFRNNVIFDWGINTVYGGEGGNYNVVNNYYKYGPNTGKGVKYRVCNPSFSATVPVGKWYVGGNYVDESPANTANNWLGVAADDTNQAKALTPFNLGYPLNTQSPTDAYEAVLQGAGCSLPNRDTLDQRIVNDVRNRTGSIIDVQGGYPHGTPYEQTVNAWPALASQAAPADSDHDGMPDSYETAHGLNPADASDRSGIASNGYTHLENYLNGLTNAVADTNPVIYANPSFGVFNQTIGSPSAVQNISFSAYNLTSALLVTAPSNFQLSTDGVNWASSITLNPSAGRIASTTISVRLNAPANGSYAGNLVAASGGAASLSFAIAGTTADPVPVLIKQKQIIGFFPLVEGGFENQAAGTVSTTVPGAGVNLSQTVWTTSGSANIVKDGTARTGSNHFTYTSTSGSTKNVYSPTVTGSVFANNTKYIVQYFYRAPAPATGNTVGGLVAVADSTNFTTGYSSVAYAGTSNGWVKTAISYSVNTAYTPFLSYGGLRFNGGGSAIVKPFDVDDFVVYPADNQASPSADVTAPDAVTAASASGNFSNGTIGVSWTAPATGVDGGGYVVVRSTSATVPVLNANGIYSMGNTPGTGNTVVYIGKTTAFTDDGSVAPLVSGTTYYYFIFTADKAFNYSAAVSASAAVTIPVATVSLTGNINPFSQTVGNPSATQSFKVTGSNLSGKVSVTAPAGFELSEDENTWSSSLLLTPESNSMNATGFVRMNTSTAGNYSGNLSASSTGATAATLAVGGTATVVYQVKVYTAANADVVVAKDGTGNYASIQAAIDAAPTGRTAPYVIFIKNGKYVEKVNIPSNKPFIHLIGESVANTIISWDSYSGKVENGVNIGTNNSATLTVNANDFFMMSVTVENATGYVGDGPQALAIYISGDRCVYKNCRFIGGQDTVWHNGSGKHLFKNCYIDGNTDFIFGSSTALFDSCIIYPRDRIDGGGGGFITAANTGAGQAYGEVFRNCILTKNRGVTTYSLGRPWGNAPRTVYINCSMSNSINPTGWSTWNIDPSLITYAEYKSKKYDGSLVDVSKRLSWSQQLTDEQAAAYYNNTNLFGSWDPYFAFPALNAAVPAELAVANFRAQRNSSNITLSWNLSWPLSGVQFELYRSTDNVNFTKVNEITGGADSVVAFSLTDALPAKGTVYYYFVKASKNGYAANSSYMAYIDPSIPLNGDFRSRASGGWTNTTTAFTTIAGGSVTGITVTASNRGYTGVPAVTFGAAPTGGVTATGTAILTDGVVTGVNITHPGSGYTSAPSITFSTTGVSANTIWEKYNSSTKAWESVALGTGASGNVTISAGDTVILNSLVGINNLSIEKGGFFQTDVQGKNLRIKGDINNSGVFGGADPAVNKITLELDGINGIYNINGDGLYNFSGVRALTGVSNIVLNINSNMVLSGGLQAWYGSNNSTWDYGTNDVIINVNRGATVQAGYLHSSSTNDFVVKTVGKYTYNVKGTLDMSSSILLTSLVPHKTIAQPITLNVTGLLKLGKQFSTHLTPVAGSLFLNISDSGLVDATKTTTFTMNANYFVVSGIGALKRTVGTTSVVFPVGTAADSYNPVTLINTGAADNFSVSVKNNFDQAVNDPAKVVNKQWTILEDVAGGSILTAKLGWATKDQASAFNPAGQLAVMQFATRNWNNTVATLSGSGTLADLYIATASGITGLGTFGVTNFVKTAPDFQLSDSSLTYDGQPHTVAGFAYGREGKSDKLSPELSLTYTNASGQVLEGAPVAAGIYQVEASFDGNSSYLPAKHTATLTILPKALVVKANNQTKECGTVLNLGTTTFTTDGLVGSDAINSVSLSSTGATLSGTVGTYPIEVSDAQGTGLTNYTIIYEQGTLLVQDKIKPVPVVAALPEITGECSATVIEAPKATDGCAGIITATTTDPMTYSAQGTYTITWQYNDGNGNVTFQTQTVVVKDGTKPVVTAVPKAQEFCYSTDPYIIPALTATDNCGIASITYAITGATNRTGTGANASGVFNVGESTISWTVRDVHGNESVATTIITVKEPVYASIPDVYAVSQKVDNKNTLYLGYGPSSLTLTTQILGGTAPYTYQWNNGQTTASIAVTSPGIYSVTVTDAEGCKSKPSEAPVQIVASTTNTAAANNGIIEIKVVDVRCGNDNTKVQVCHNGKAICVASAAVQDHLNHGDKIGTCSNAASVIGATVIGEEVSGYQVRMYPNPVEQTLNIQVSSFQAGAMVQVYNATGAVVLMQRLTNAVQSLSVSRLTPGIYYVKVSNGDKVTTEKIIKQ